MTTNTLTDEQAERLYFPPKSPAEYEQALNELTHALSTLASVHDENQRLKRELAQHYHARDRRLETLKRQNDQIRGLTAALQQEQAAHKATLDLVADALAQAQHKASA